MDICFKVMEIHWSTCLWTLGNALGIVKVFVLLLSGLHRNSQEKAGFLEAAGPQTAPPVSSESYAGHACVPTERVSLCWPSVPLISFSWMLHFPYTRPHCLSLWFFLFQITSTSEQEVVSITKHSVWELALNSDVCFFFFLFSFFKLQLDLWVQLPPHSRLCEWSCRAAGTKAVPADSSWTSSRTHRSSESRRHRGSVSAPHTH